MLCNFFNKQCRRLGIYEQFEKKFFLFESNYNVSGFKQEMIIHKRYTVYSFNLWQLF